MEPYVLKTEKIVRHTNLGNIGKCQIVTSNCKTEALVRCSASEVVWTYQKWLKEQKNSKSATEL